MIPRKPYERKPLKHSPRGRDVLENSESFLIRSFTGTRDVVEVRLRDPGQCVAALRRAKERNVRLLVYAIGTAYGEECLELVDEEWLMERMNR